MHDPTGSSVPSERGTGSLSSDRPSVPPWNSDHEEDKLLACLLITKWALLTGRTLRADVPPHLLSAEELVGFWADEQMITDQPEFTGAMPCSDDAAAIKRPCVRSLFPSPMTAVPVRPHKS